ncbi:hypothetical protein LLEC1_02737 [Akanthomyces lecanii]|uniref:AB hydrolase-1 domain-containing protein n=1 Tax=Cordyceps confragosa TaxID=2714763 RepID=A0A179IDZ9_CORDF|nr:hypothetical protein LLEC1_02737 [Akanthomyces lecanii]
MTSSTAPPTTLSLRGILLDIYGLEQVKDACKITCLWLLHPRTYSRTVMESFAWQTISAAKQRIAEPKHAIIALAFDLPNHGSRLIDQAATLEWSEGNKNHAIDLLETVLRGRQDLSALISHFEERYGRDRIQQHLVLGWSLGGHTAWQAWLWDQRVASAVIIVGCPDLPGLLKNRAQRSKLPLDGPFFGGVYFPDELVEKCLQRDPKTFVFGTAETKPLRILPTDESEMKSVFDETIRGKSLLVCSGQEDELVPYAISQPFLEFLQTSVKENGWYASGNVRVDNKVYQGVGHEFSQEMAHDAIDWIMDVVLSPGKTSPRAENLARC